MQRSKPIPMGLILPAAACMGELVPRHCIGWGWIYGEIGSDLHAFCPSIRDWVLRGQRESRSYTENPGRTQGRKEVPHLQCASRWDPGEEDSHACMAHPGVGDSQSPVSVHVEPCPAISGPHSPPWRVGRRPLGTHRRPVPLDTDIGACGSRRCPPGRGRAGWWGGLQIGRAHV